jgi:nucleoside-diphosphate kinase
MEIEQSLVLIKPDALERGLVGEIITRFEKTGLKIVGLKQVWPTKEMVSDHYGDLDVRVSPIVKKLMVDFLTSGPVVAIVFDGIDVVNKVRLMVGSTYPSQALPGTIRGDMAHVSKDYANALEIGVKNLIHASGDPADAKREIALWFDKSELVSYELVHEKHTRK